MELKEVIADILKSHTRGAEGCICGNAPDVFWEKEQNAHIADVIAAVIDVSATTGLPYGAVYLATRPRRY